MKKAFLIGAVRSKPADYLEIHVREIESMGYEVYWPARDTNQDDSTGFYICTENRTAIEQADVVFVAWDGNSMGSHFDLGMAFALRKRIGVVDLSPREPTPQKSFRNMIIEWLKLDWEIAHRRGQHRLSGERRGSRGGNLWEE